MTVIHKGIRFSFQRNFLEKRKKKMLAVSTGCRPKEFSGNLTFFHFGQNGINPSDFSGS
jgi:hypothetical protein